VELAGVQMAVAGARLNNFKHVTKNNLGNTIFIINE
jgi:hypothetical protein